MHNQHLSSFTLSPFPFPQIAPALAHAFSMSISPDTQKIPPQPPRLPATYKCQHENINLSTCSKKLEHLLNSPFSLRNPWIHPHVLRATSNFSHPSTKLKKKSLRTQSKFETVIPTIFLPT